MESLPRQFRFSFLASGDDGARNKVFKEIWDNYQPKIVLFVKSISQMNDAEAEDLTQEIMLKVWMNLHRYNPVYSFNAWIYTLARNHCIDHLRKNPASREMGLDESGIADKVCADSSPPAEQTVIEGQLHRLVDGFLESLDPGHRQAAFLRFHQGLSYRIIARIIDVPTGTVKYWIHNIREQLRSELERIYETKF